MSHREGETEKGGYHGVKLATCRGFCCSAPPCSLKPHGAPPERETTISSATIPAPSSQPAVCVTVHKVLCPSSVPHTLCEYQ